MVIESLYIPHESIKMKKILLGVLVQLFFTSFVFAEEQFPYIFKKFDDGGIIYANRDEEPKVNKLANDYCSSRNIGYAVIANPSGEARLQYNFTCVIDYSSNHKDYTKSDTQALRTSTGNSIGGGWERSKQDVATTKASDEQILSDAKKQCADLGFKPKTEKFGSCVLELRKRTQANPSSPVQTQQNVVQAPATKPQGDGSADDVTCQRYGFTPQTDTYGQCRLQIDMARREMQAQQARYAEQQRQYQAELDRQRSLKQAEFWARYGSGETPNQALINTWGNGVAKPVQPPTTRTYILPGGRPMSCTTTGDITSCL